MLKFDKDIYYELYGCSNIKKIDKETYLQANKEFVDTHVSRDFDEFRPNGKRRLELGSLILQIRILCAKLGDEQFTKDIYDYLTFIEYDAKQINKERQIALEKILVNKM